MGLLSPVFFELGWRRAVLLQVVKIGQTFDLSVAACCVNWGSDTRRRSRGPPRISRIRISLVTMDDARMAPQCRGPPNSKEKEQALLTMLLLSATCTGLDGMPTEWKEIGIVYATSVLFASGYDWAFGNNTLTMATSCGPAALALPLSHYHLHTQKEPT